MLLSWKLIAQIISLLFSRLQKQRTKFVSVLWRKNPRLQTVMIHGALATTKHKLFKSIRDWCWLVPTDLKLKQVKNTRILIGSEIISLLLTHLHSDNDKEYSA